MASFEHPGERCLGRLLWPFKVLFKYSSRVAVLLVERHCCSRLLISGKGRSPDTFSICDTNWVLGGTSAEIVRQINDRRQNGGGGDTFPKEHSVPCVVRAPVPRPSPH